nr:MAG TPA: hypothetical protein [Caudoviricetes sp.]
MSFKSSCACFNSSAASFIVSGSVSHHSVTL